MRAAVVHDGSITIDDVDVPSPEAGQLLLRVLACGICGSDLKLVGTLPAGAIMGHEFCGEVVDAAPDVAAEFPPGTLVAAMPTGGCGSCRDCDDDDPARCSDSRLLGIGSAPGAFGEHVVVTAADSVALPPGTDPVLGALVEPIAVGLHLVNAGRISGGERVLVIGAGSVGLAVVLWAKHRGAAHVTVSDTSPDRRAGALDVGVDAVVDPASDEIGTGFDVVIECVGARGMIAETLKALRPRGIGVIGGICLEEDSFYPVFAVTSDQTLAFSSYYTRREFAESARALTDGELDVSRLVTGRIGLDELPQMITELTGPTTHRKVVVIPTSS